MQKAEPLRCLALRTRGVLSSITKLTPKTSFPNLIEIFFFCQKGNHNTIELKYIPSGMSPMRDALGLTEILLCLVTGCLKEEVARPKSPILM